MGKHYSLEFKQKVINDYNSGINGGLDLIAKKYNIPRQSLYKWIIKDRKQGNQLNDVENNRGRPKDENIDYKERYEILKKYLVFLKAQRERKWHLLTYT